jgi:hypothetical protein
MTYPKRNRSAREVPFGLTFIARAGLVSQMQKPAARLNHEEHEEHEESKDS